MPLLSERHLSPIQLLHTYTAWSHCGALWVLSIVQGYTTVLLEPVGSDNERAGQVKAVLMGSAVNQDGRSGGLTVGIPARASSLLLTRLQQPKAFLHVLSILWQHCILCLILFLTGSHDVSYAENADVQMSR